VLSITRQPRLLVKMPVGLRQLGLSFQAAQFDVRIEPLFKSINATQGLGVAPALQWHLVSATAAADEVNAWVMCHHLVSQGFGVAGACAPEFAEPDLEQHLLAYKERTDDVQDTVLLKQVSPVAWQNINLYGRYEFSKGPEAINMNAIIQEQIRANCWARMGGRRHD
jgi:hypothetical protein